MTSFSRFSLLAFPVLLLALFVTWLPRMHQMSRDPAVEAARTVAEPVVRTEAERQLDRELSEIGGKFAGHVGIAVYDVEADRVMQFGGLDLYPQQSVSKLWVSMTALDLADRGKLDLADEVTIRRRDLTLFHQPIRGEVLAKGSFTTDYGDLMTRALTHSDNTANDTILRRVGGAKAVEKFLKRWNVDGIRFGKDERHKQSAIAGLKWKQKYSIANRFFEARDKVPEAKRREAFESYLADPVDGASPVGIAVAFGRLAKGDLLSSVSAKLMLATLETTHSGPNRLKGAVPEGWTIAHKTGTGQFFGGEQSGYNDVGLITSPDGREYGIAVMIARTRVPTLERMDMMHEVVRALIRYDAARGAGTG